MGFAALAGAGCHPPTTFPCTAVGRARRLVLAEMYRRRHALPFIRRVLRNQLARPRA